MLLLFSFSPASCLFHKYKTENPRAWVTRGCLLREVLSYCLGPKLQNSFHKEKTPDSVGVCKSSFFGIDPTTESFSRQKHAEGQRESLWLFGWKALDVKRKSVPWRMDRFITVFQGQGDVFYTRDPIPIFGDHLKKVSSSEIMTRN